MTEREVLERISSIKPWKRKGERAPHKPFLILYALGQLQNGVRQISYMEHEERLKKLFREFGPARKPTMSNPFTRLANDNIWKLETNTDLDLTGTYSDKDLRDFNAVGSFKPEVLDVFVKSPQAIIAVAEQVLHQNFPESIHEDILQAVGLDLETTIGRIKKKRDPNFRFKVLEAYERSCAICGYQIRRDDQIIGLEAAHIKWHQFEGPDVEQNGIAMCTMHHKLFDYGLFALDQDLILKVSRKANGGFGLKEWLLNFHIKPIRKPISRKDYPEQEFTQWQVNEVFKGGYRD